MIHDITINDSSFFFYDRYIMSDNVPLGLKQWVYSLSTDELLKAMSFQFSGSYDITLIHSASHEFHLLKEMIDLQVSPTVPIFSRAVALSPASSRGVTDGRDALNISYNARLKKPRLFQFIPDGEDWSCHYKVPNNKTQEKKARVTKRRQRNEITFQVIARKFIAPWGDVWSLGTTETQRWADDQILLGTCIDYGDHSDWKNIPTVASCFFDPESTHRNTHDILRMLHIVSRGMFLRTDGPYLESSHSIPFCAPWLEPTQQWFSLPKYLVSRYDVALREAYVEWLRTLPSKRVTEANNTRSTFLRSLDWTMNIHNSSDWNRFLNTVPGRQILFKAVKFAFIDLWKQDAKLLVRDMTLSTIIHGIFNFLYYKRVSLPIASIPIVFLGTHADIFRLRILTFLQEELSRVAEEHLIQSFYKDDDTQQPTEKKKKRRNCGRRNNIKHFKLHRQPLSTSPNMVPEIKLGGPTEPMTIEKSRDTIFVLSLLDDILNTVFDQVGLESAVSHTLVPQQGDSDAVKIASSVNVVMVDPVERISDDTNLLQSVSPFEDKHSPEAKDPKPATMNIVEANAHDSFSFQKDSPVKVNGPTEERVICNKPIEGIILPSSPLSLTLDASTVSPLPARQWVSLHDFMLQQQGHHHHEPSVAIVNALRAHDDGNFYIIEDVGLVSDLWWSLRPYSSRDKSIFADFFQEDQDRHDFVALSTAASLASSMQEDDVAISNIIQDDNLIMEMDVSSNLERDDQFEESSVDKNLSIGVGMTIIEESDDDTPLNRESKPDQDHEGPEQPCFLQTRCSEIEGVTKQYCLAGKDEFLPSSHFSHGHAKNDTTDNCKTYPHAPHILISLADLDKLKRKRQTFSEISCGRFSDKSLSSSDVLDIISLPKNVVALKLPTSSSKEDFRIHSRENLFPALRKRNSLYDQRARSVSSHDALDMNHSTRSFDHKKYIDSHRTSITRVASNQEVIIDAGNIHLNFCAQSEAAMNGLEESSHLNVIPKALGNDEELTAFRDENSTISSVQSPIQGELTSVRDERNGYRDLCLSLAAENAKIKNILALALQSLQSSSIVNHDDPMFIRPFDQNLHTKGNARIETFNYTGLHHIADDRSSFLEASVAFGADTASSDYLTHCGTHLTFQHINLLGPIRHVHLNGLETRLTTEIKNFLKNVDAHLKRLSSCRGIATARLRRLVTIIWPRAQVKIYGSHLSNLSLPTSDMDFVICLPAVHKNAPVDAAGVLEGRNATNEPHQKVLARKLRHESWIDPRSIRVIERTTVPVIKVQTKDVHARQLQLDITFDSPEHFGLKAAQLVRTLMNDLPTIRPLVLILKQFLLDRGLLTAYTGGLSSFCLFLMVTRYCQEQPCSSWTDPGALLIGLLDFYGNHFDPRRIGISVGRRRYFQRPRYSDQVAQPLQPQMNMRSRTTNNVVPSLVGFDDMNTLNTSPNMLPTGAGQAPFTFDPLFVEDPLNPNNNVGRNAFRIFQIKRAFSDAHQAITASLECALSSSSELYDCDHDSLLKCLLLSKDGAAINGE